MTDLVEVPEVITKRRRPMWSRDRQAASISLPSPAARKELFVTIRTLAGGDFLSANLSREVVQIVRQSQSDAWQNELEEFSFQENSWQNELEESSFQENSWQGETGERESDLPLLTSRLASILYDAECEGRLPEVIDSFGKMVAEIAKGGETAWSFLDHARRLDGRSQTDTALDIIFDQVDEMLLAGEFDRVNQLLIDTTTDEFSVELLLGILTATLPAKDRLPNRCEFFGRVVQTLQSRGEFKDRLLVGLD